MTQPNDPEAIPPAGEAAPRWFPTALLAGVALILLTRMPQILSPYFVADGDECILGLMAKHLLSGGQVPVFFWGQRYGLSALEAALAAGWFAALGVSAHALKLAMLTLWTGGWAMFTLAARRLAGTRAALLAGALLIFCPAWGSWSLKARGGYLTAFFLAGLILFLVAGARRRGGMRFRAALALGALLALTCFAQFFWLVCLIPFLFLLPLRRLGRRGWLGVLLGGAVTGTFLLLLTPEAKRIVWAPNLFIDLGPAYALAELPWRLWVCLGGAFWQNSMLAMSPWMQFTAWSWCVLLGFAVRWAPVIRHPLSAPPARAAALAVLLSLGITVYLNSNFFGFRYLLPAPTFLCLLAGLLLDRMLAQRRGWRVLAGVALGLAIAGGGETLYEFGDLCFSSSYTSDGLARVGDYDQVIRILRGRKVRHAYTMDPGMQWELAFASNEEVVARWKKRDDRWPPYVEEVDRALKKGGPVAVVARGTLSDMVRDQVQNTPNGAREVIMLPSHQLIAIAPSRELLASLDFELPEPSKKRPAD